MALPRSTAARNRWSDDVVASPCLKVDIAATRRNDDRAGANGWR
jgi:hypothetical protein